MLAFLFMLGSLKLGRVRLSLPICERFANVVQRYRISSLSTLQRQVLVDLRHLGLAYQQDDSDSGFYPTRLATTLTSAAAADASRDTEPTGFLILETNYRVYAYTGNSLQLAILNLFVSLKTRFPNLAIGSITRESVKNALANGINADQARPPVCGRCKEPTQPQIISYLGTHAHSQMRKQAAAKDARPLLALSKYG